jgi:hypothetical protein
MMPSMISRLSWGSLEIDRRRVFPYFGTGSGYLLRLFALYGLAVLGAGFAMTF